MLRSLVLCGGQRGSLTLDALDARRRQMLYTRLNAWLDALLDALLRLLDLLRLLRTQELCVLARACACQSLLRTRSRSRMHGRGSLQHHNLRVVLVGHGAGLFWCEIRVLGPERILQLPDLRHHTRRQLLWRRHRTRRPCWHRHHIKSAGHRRR